MGPGEAGIIGWLLQTKALIMIIFANILLDKQIITSETFTALLLMAVASTMLTVPVVAPGWRAAEVADYAFRLRRPPWPTCRPMSKKRQRGRRSTPVPALPCLNSAPTGAATARPRSRPLRRRWPGIRAGA